MFLNTKSRPAKLPIRIATMDVEFEGVRRNCLVHLQDTCQPLWEAMMEDAQHICFRSEHAKAAKVSLLHHDED